MALIKCPECENEISDKAEACPKCGCPIVQESEISESDSTTKPKKAINKKVLTIVIGLIVVIAIFVISALIIKSNKEKQKAEQARTEYIESMNDMHSIIYAGTLIAESKGKLIHDVWYNAIYEELGIATDKYTRSESGAYYDFNTALSNLFNDEDFKKDIEVLKKSKETADGLYLDLQNPPEDMKNCYNAMDSVYNTYSKFINLIINPTGSLTDFTQNYNDTDHLLSENFDKFKLLIPEQKAEE